MLSFLQDNLAILTLLILALLVLALLGLILWAAIKGANAEETAPEAQAIRLSSDSLKASFRRAVELIEDNIAARSERYSIPWVIVINERMGAQSLPLPQSGIQSALSSDATLTAAAQGIEWNFFDRGAVVQLQGDHLGPADSDGGDVRTWEEFLNLCRDYRADRPLDSLVVALPAHLLLRDDPQAALEIAGCAKALHRRLWLAQNRFALRFPVYLLVTGCEAIPGFAHFAHALPDAMRRSMLGWSVPFDLAAPYRTEWIDDAMDAVAASISDATTELSAGLSDSSDSTAYFLLAQDIQRIRSSLRAYADELMRPSVYHEPFIFRGIYLSGDSSDAAVLSAPNRNADPAAYAPTMAREAGSDRRPAFLRDVFEEKIFGESGLVRPTSQQRLRRPVMTWTARWAAMALGAVWLGGMAYSTIRIGRLTEDISTAIVTLDRETADANLALRTNKLDPVAERRRALDAIQLLSLVDAGAMSSIFMPGSWPLFDDIESRLQRRLETRFSENSIGPVRRGMYSRVAELTGVPQDPATGELIIGSACSLPQGWAQAVEGRQSTSLAVEDAPEFAALSLFMAKAEQLEQVLRARAQLVDGSRPADGADLKLLVQYSLGSELRGDTDRSAALFRRYSSQLKQFNSGAVSQALACSFGLASGELARRLFADNELLRLEVAIGQQLESLRTSMGKDTQATVADWRSLLEDMRRQEELLQAGKGSWIGKRTVALGQGYDGLMARASALTLIGAGPVEVARASVETEYGKFRDEWEQSVSQDREGAMPPLMWSEKDNRWVVSEDRAAIRQTMGSLLGQAWMNPATRRAIPAPGSFVFASWDRVKLDQALGMLEVRKRVQAEQLSRLPSGLRPEFERVVDRLLSEVVADLTAQALVPSVRAASGGAGDGERLRLQRIQALLGEMGARDIADALAAGLAADSMARLRQIDEALQKADLLTPRSRDFKEWGGERSPLQSAFGVSDAPALAAYLAEQVQRVEAMAKEAEPLLGTLDTSPGGSPTTARWSGIVGDLVRYRAKSPTSTLMALEQFITAGAADIDRQNCSDKLLAKPVAVKRSTNFFSERLTALQSGLADRCRELLALDQQESWTSFSEEFNFRLAGRAPFAPVPARASARDPGLAPASAGVGRPPVDAEEVAQTLRLFERSWRALQDRNADTKSPRARSALDVRLAAEQMERVRAFLSPLFPSDDSSPAGLDLTVEFRANASAELEGNKIIEWSLASGAQQLRSRETPRPLRWEPGMPLVLSVRLARDVPLTPRQESAQPWMRVDDKTVTYRFSDPWALQTMLLALRDSEESSPKSDGRAQLLRLEFPLASASEGPAVLAGESRARVFVRLTISAPGKRAALAWPGAFPSRMPEWPVR